MKNVLRRLRGLMGTGITWAAGFVVCMGGFFGVVGWFGEFLAELPTVALLGFMMGCGFGGLLAFTERSRSLGDLALWRVALWGAIGGFLGAGVFGLYIGDLPPLGIWSGLTGLSAAFASGQVALAKRGERQSIEGEDTAFLLEEGE